ncbi:MAG: HEAT repeat domain-containing protein [Microthrixaceae bacterium]
MDSTREIVKAGHRGDAAAIRPELASGNPEHRVAALGALARIGSLHAGEFALAAHDPDPKVRSRAATIAPKAFAPGEELPIIELTRLLGDPEWSVAEAATWALGELTTAEPGSLRSAAATDAVDALVRMTTAHVDALCREAAVAALGSIGVDSGLDAVLTACGDRANVRRRAVLALAAFDDPRASQMLAELTGDRDLQVSQAAEDLLAIERGEPT